MNRRPLAVLSLFIVLLVGAGAVSGAATKAPNFTLTDIDGHTFSLSDYSGQRVLINFFYTR